MILETSTIETLAIVGGVGAVAGLLGGVLAGAPNLFATILVGAIGGITLSMIFRFAGAPPIASVGDDFSLVWAGVGGLVLAFAVGRSNK